MTVVLNDYIPQARCGFLRTQLNLRQNIFVLRLCSPRGVFLKKIPLNAYMVACFYENGWVWTSKKGLALFSTGFLYKKKDEKIYKKAINHALYSCQKTQNMLK